MRNAESMSQLQIGENRIVKMMMGQQQQQQVTQSEVVKKGRVSLEEHMFPLEVMRNVREAVKGNVN